MERADVGIIHGAFSRPQSSVSGAWQCTATTTRQPASFTAGAAAAPITASKR